MKDFGVRNIQYIVILIGLFFISSCVSSSTGLSPERQKRIRRVEAMDQKIQLLSTPESPLPQPTPQHELPLETIVHSAPATWSNYIRYSPDGKLLLMGDGSSTGSSIWDLATGLRLRTLKHGTHNGCFSPDGKYIVTTDMGSAKLWEASTGKELRTFGLGYAKGLNTKINFSSDGKYIIINDNGSRLWEVSTGREITMQGTVFDFKNKTHDIPSYFSFDGKRVVVYKNGYKLVDVSTGSVINELTDSSFVQGFSPDSKYCITQNMGEKTFIELWDASSGIKVSSFMGNVGFSPTIDRVIISPDNQYMAVFKSGVTNGEVFFTVTFWDAFKGMKIRNLPSVKGSVTGTVFSPDGKYLAITAYNYMEKDPTNPTYSIKIHEISTGRTIYHTSQQGHMPMSFAFSPDGKSYAVSEKKGINIYETSTSKTIMAFSEALKEKQPISITAGFRPDGKSIVTYGADGSKVWDLTGTGNIKTVNGFSGFGNVSPDGRYTLGISKMTVELFDAVRGKKMRTFTGHNGPVNSAVFSPDGKYVATGSGFIDGVDKSKGKSVDNTARIWDVKTGKELRKFKHSKWIRSVSFSPDSQYLLAAGGIVFTGTGTKDKIFSKTTLWNVGTGSKVMTVKGGTAAFFDPDGRYFVTINEDRDILAMNENKSLLFWDVTTEKNIKTLTLPQSVSSTNHSVSTFSISPDGKFLAAAAGFNCLIWDIDSNNLVKTYREPGYVVSIDFSPDGKQILTAYNGTAKIRDFTTGKEKISLITIGKKDWVVKTDDGFFDSTEGAKKDVYFVKGMQTYELDQFFEDFYRPKLLGMVISGKEMELPKINIAEKIIQSPPPSVEIITPSKGDKFAKNVIEVKVKITDNGGGIDEVKLLHNGKRISEDTRGIKITQKKEGNSIIRSYSATLVSGKNTFAASAYSKERIESRGFQIDVLFQGNTKTASSYLLAIGINKYKNKRLNLNYARQDAEAFMGLVSQKSRSLFQNVHTVSFYDKQATRMNIMEALDAIAQKAGPEDVFTFYYAGHGSMVDNVFYLIPTDNVRLYESERLNKEAISSKALQEKFAKIKALKQLVILDACQSGAATEMLAMRGAAEEKALAQLARSSGVHVLASAGSEQFATEFAELGHGVFTYALLQGLQGGADGAPEDGKITIYELKSFIDDQVPELTEKYKGEVQYPNTFSKGHDFPLILK